MRGILLSTVIVILMLSCVSALEVNVKTLNFYDVSVFALKSDQVYSLIDSFHKTTDGYGIVSGTLNVLDDEIKLKVLVKQNNEVVFSKDFEDVSTASPIYVEMFSDSKKIVDSFESEPETPVVNVTEPTVNETIGVQQAEPINSSSGLTGKVIENVTSTISEYKTLTYVVLAVLALGILLFAFRKKISGFRSRPSAPSPAMYSKPTPSSPTSAVSEERDIEQEIADAEQKIIAAQKQISLIRNKESIIKAERKLEADRLELERLRSENEL